MPIGNRYPNYIPTYDKSHEVNGRPLVEVEILICIAQIQPSVAFYLETRYIQVNLFHSSSTFQIEISHLFCTAKFAVQNKWLVSIWNAELGGNRSTWIYLLNYSQPFTLAISDNTLLPIKKDKTKETPENFLLMHRKIWKTFEKFLFYLVDTNLSYPTQDQ